LINNNGTDVKLLVQILSRDCPDKFAVTIERHLGEALTIVGEENFNILMTNIISSI